MKYDNRATSLAARASCREYPALSALQKTVPPGLGASMFRQGFRRIDPLRVARWIIRARRPAGNDRLGERANRTLKGVQSSRASTQPPRGSRLSSLPLLQFWPTRDLGQASQSHLYPKDGPTCGRLRT